MYRDKGAERHIVQSDRRSLRKKLHGVVTHNNTIPKFETLQNFLDHFTHNFYVTLLIIKL